METKTPKQLLITDSGNLITPNEVKFVGKTLTSIGRAALRNNTLLVITDESEQRALCVGCPEAMAMLNSEHRLLCMYLHHTGRVIISMRKTGETEDTTAEFKLAAAHVAHVLTCLGMVEQPTS